MSNRYVCGLLKCGNVSERYVEKEEEAEVFRLSHLIKHRLQLFSDSFRDHQVKCVSHTPKIKPCPCHALTMHRDYVEFTQALMNTERTQKD